MNAADPTHSGGPVHPGDALSGLLDGALDPMEAQVVAAHVEGCRACAEELHWARAARWTLRSLPPVEPPAGFFENLLARSPLEGGDTGELAPVVALESRRRTWSRVASVAAGLALFALTVAGADPGPYSPAVDAAVERHAASLMVLSTVGAGALDGGRDPVGDEAMVTPTTAPPQDTQGLAAPFQAPGRLAGGYRLVEAFAHPEGLQLFYRSGRYGLSVFEAPGHLDVADLPADGATVDVAGVPGWRWERDGVDGRVVIFEREGLVVSVVGDEPGDAVTEAAASMPGPRPLSLGQQVGEAALQVFEALSP